MRRDPRSVGETKKFHEVHPGVLLKEELQARGLSAAAFALKLRVSPRRVQEIVVGKRAITPETALRIGTALGTAGLQHIRRRKDESAALFSRYAISPIDHKVRQIIAGRRLPQGSSIGLHVFELV